MKKKFLALILAILIVATAAWALDWTTANQATVAWDAVTTDVDGGQIVLEANERMTYVVYLANSVTDPNKTNPAEVGRAQALQQLITLAQKGSYFVGVKAMIEADDGAGNWSMVSESEVVWSDDPTYVQDGTTFGIRYYPAPNAPRGLRPVTG